MGKNGEPPISLFVVHWNRPTECDATVHSLLDQGIDLKVTTHLSQKLPTDLLLSILKSGKFITEVQTAVAAFPLPATN